MFFRQEAIDYFHRDSAQGQILLRSPAILWGCSIAALALCAAIVVVVFQATYTPKIPSAGKIVQGEDSMLVEIWVPSNALPALRIGQRLPLNLATVSAADQSRCHGLVKDISRVPVRSVQGKAQYRVSLKPEQPAQDASCASHPVAAGMEVSTEIILDKIRLLDWIIQPVRPAEKKP